MEKKISNRVFAILIILHISISFILAFALPNLQMNMVTNLLLSQSLIIIPGIIGIIMWSMNKDRTETWYQRLNFRKMKISTGLLTVVFTFLIMPLTTLVNVISMLFVDNTVAGMSGMILEMPFFAMLFMMAIFGPFCEEFVFRGVIYAGYRRENATLGALLLSALLFGVMHMNLNQALYAFVIGIALALLVEATGSFWSAFICHFIFNANSVCLMYLMNALMPEEVEQSASQPMLAEELYMMISVYMMIALVSTALAVCLLVYMAKRENRVEKLYALLPKKSPKGNSLWSPSLIVGLVLGVGFIIFELVLTAIYM